MGRSSDWKIFILALTFLLCAALPWLWVGEACILYRQELEAREVGAWEPDAPESAPAEKLVALTFDDGPRRSTTTALLDGLSQRGIHATFFLIGLNVEGNEDLVSRMKEEGHQIGVHSANHKKLTELNGEDFYEEVGAFRERLSALTGDSDFLLRPPYGMVDSGVERRAAAPIILWSVDTEDWSDKDADRIAAQIVAEAEDGDIILLHDIYPSSVEAALRAADALMEKGFYLVTVEELFAAKGLTLEPGECYRCAKS